MERLGFIGQSERKSLAPKVLTDKVTETHQLTSDTYTTHICDRNRQVLSIFSAVVRKMFLALEENIWSFVSL